MDIQLTADQKAFVQQAIESGRIHRAEDAVQQALSLWEERERTRAEILAAVDAANLFPPLWFNICQTPLQVCNRFQALRFLQPMG